MYILSLQRSLLYCSIVDGVAHEVYCIVDGVAHEVYYIVDGVAHEVYYIVDGVAHEVYYIVDGVPHEVYYSGRRFYQYNEDDFRFQFWFILSRWTA